MDKKLNVLFMSLSDYDSIYKSGLYTDLLRQFLKDGHSVYIISPIERKEHKHKDIIKEGNAVIVKIKIFNMQKTNIFEKGISMLTIEKIFINAIRKYFSDVKFDLIIYPTPPITLIKAVEYVKQRDEAKSYLLLKDIFPQNAVDLGMMQKTGLKKILYRYFRSKEKKLYAVSDFIGCMSKANVDYVIKHNPEVNPEIVEVCPNCVEAVDMSVDVERRINIRNKYGIPFDKKVFIYGGNLGKPQGIDFMIECLKSQENNQDVFFLIVGNGTEFGKIENYLKSDKPSNVKLMKKLSKEDYNVMVGACDVGMIFLDHRFTIPNFPSRLLSYMQAKLPVFAVTDTCTDIGEVIVDNDFGWWSESNNVENFKRNLNKIILDEINFAQKGKNAFEFLINNYSSKFAYRTIIKKFNK